MFNYSMGFEGGSVQLFNEFHSKYSVLTLSPPTLLQAECHSIGLTQMGFGAERAKLESTSMLCCCVVVRDKLHYIRAALMQPLP